MAVKQCKRCHVLQDLSRFAPSRTCRGGYSHQCRACQAVMKRESRRRMDRFRERLLASAKAREGSPRVDLLSPRAHPPLPTFHNWRNGELEEPLVAWQRGRN